MGWSEGRWRSDRPAAAVTVVKLKCLEKPADDPEPPKSNGHASLRRVTFICDPKGGEEAIGINVGPRDQHGVPLLPPTLVPPDRFAEHVFRKGQRIIVTADHPLVQVLRSCPEFRVPGYWETHEE